MYDDNGHRITKRSYHTTSPYALDYTTHYMNDPGGNLLSSYVQDAGAIMPTTADEIPLHGMSELGSIFNSKGSYAYYNISDHLGNVRATFLADASVVNYSDYMPFGHQFNNSATNTEVRKGYQGAFAEKDAETELLDLNSFDWRMYDDKLGRWITEDKAKQFFSPYLGMGNNPVSGVDPDGNWVIFVGYGGSGIFVFGASSLEGKALSVDEKTGRVQFSSFSTLGGRAGYAFGGGFDALSVSIYPKANSVYDLAGWGGAFGGFAGPVGVEVNVGLLANPFAYEELYVSQVGGTGTLSYGGGEGVYFETNYTEISNTIEFKDMDEFEIWFKAHAERMVDVGIRDFIRNSLLNTRNPTINNSTKSVMYPKFR